MLCLCPVSAASSRDRWWGSQHHYKTETMTRNSGHLSPGPFISTGGWRLLHISQTNHWLLSNITSGRWADHTNNVPHNLDQDRITELSLHWWGLRAVLSRKVRLEIKAPTRSGSTGLSLHPYWCCSSASVASNPAVSCVTNHDTSLIYLTKPLSPEPSITKKIIASTISIHHTRFHL